MKILALDLGSKLGWASGLNEKVTAHGVIHLVQGKAFGNESFLAFQRWLMSTLKHVNHIVVERPNSGMPGYDGIRIHFGMYGILQSLAAHYKQPITPIAATTIKKVWTGNGHASKDEMVKKTQASGFPGVMDDNESDAIALYNSFIELHAGRVNLDGLEEDSF